MKKFSDSATTGFVFADPASLSLDTGSPAGAAPQGIIGVLVSLMAEADGFRFDGSGAVFEPDNAPLWDAICAFPDVCHTPPEALSADDDSVLKMALARGARPGRARRRLLTGSGFNVFCPLKSGV